MLCVESPDLQLHHILVYGETVKTKVAQYPISSIISSSFESIRNPKIIQNQAKMLSLDCYTYAPSDTCVTETATVC